MTLAQKLKSAEWLTQTTVQLLTGNLPGVALQLAKTLTRDADLAADLVDAFCRAMEKAGGHELEIKLPKGDWASLDLSNLDPNFPSHHPLFGLALQGLLKAASARHLDAEALERRVRQNFAGSFHETVRGSDKAKLMQYLADFKHAYDLPEGQLMEHTNQVLISLSNPLPIDPSTTLKRMYVEPEAHYLMMAGDDKEKEKVKVSLLPHLAQVLQESREPVVVHGQPGHGKSSAMRMLVHACVAAREPGEEPPTLLFLEFKNLGQLNRNEFVILRERCPFIQGEAFFHGRNTLLILDGMDERQVTENADGDLKEFLRLTMALARRINQRAGSRLNLVITGRSQFFQGVRGAFHHYHAYELLDFDEERIECWLAKFNQQKQLEQPWSYAKLHACQFGELLGQPILLTMVGLLISDPKQRQQIQSMDKVNRTKVYETIIEWTHQKRWHEDKKCPEMDRDSFFNLLQAVAFCLFCGGSENIRFTDLTKELERHKGLLDLELPKADHLEKLCSELAISFFFKGAEDKAFSFIHKSFGDFLLVRAMFSTLKRLAGLKVRNSVADLYLLLGARPLSKEDHWSFMRETAKNAREQSQRLIPTLKEFFIAAQNHSYLLQYGKDHGDNPVATEAALLSGALTWLVACNQVQEKPELLAVFGDRAAFYRFLGLLEAAPFKTIKAFAYLDLREAYLWHVDFADAYLAHANLARANLADAYLASANLASANLASANLASADLASADLASANLASANLASANLASADLASANLASANLASANLASANLASADLASANLAYANLARAVLVDTDLKGIQNWESIRNLESATIVKILNPPPGFLEHVQRLKAEQAER